MNKKVIAGIIFTFVFIGSIFLGFNLGKQDAKLVHSSKVVQTNSDKKTQRIGGNGEISTQKNIKKKPWKGSIENIFFHPLISNPEVAFNGDKRSNNFDDWFITVGEFNKILKSIYDKDYILVNIKDVYEEYEQNGQKRMRRKELLIPEGKKPIIMSVDDLSYNDGMRGGTSDKIILDSKGDIATFTKGDNEEEKISKDNEIIPIIEGFIKIHPEFSLNGARPTIALTGYQGILGYSTDLSSKNYESERKEAKKVVDKLKKLGWSFASHSYGHNNTQKMPLDKFKIDTDKWEREVASLIGQTPIYVYPHGFSVKSSDSKLKYLQSKGFKIFYSVGKEPYEQILKDSCGVLADRMAVDGITLRKRRERFMKFYDSKDIIDLSVRPKREVGF
ncbi:polysaccharide deacetylase family protein [Clostridium brassicae]|uniref:NodB homology domain-containing protein n=1 Tax=Clostridium brassicae TaxID=2999072 RepID=A0ABT4DFZ4_9CLOT|nr:hypothetical protein [Clostridium brassicae]MCY6959944.1 hypothetical protein [Clostridium brassicae]